jgi:hypothetical protein
MCPPDYPYAAELTNTMGWNMTNEDFALIVHLNEGCMFFMKIPPRRYCFVSYGKRLVCNQLTRSQKGAEASRSCSQLPPQ